MFRYTISFLLVHIPPRGVVKEWKVILNDMWSSIGNLKCTAYDFCRSEMKWGEIFCFQCVSYKFRKGRCCHKAMCVNLNARAKGSYPAYNFLISELFEAEVLLCHPAKAKIAVFKSPQHVLIMQFYILTL